jgi:hypothetical protein
MITESNYSICVVGWAGFARVMLVMIGVFDVIQGPVTQEWVFEFDITAWGRIQLILGVILIASGVGIFSANVATICTASIWALTAHGRDMAA